MPSSAAPKPFQPRPLLERKLTREPAGDMGNGVTAFMAVPHGGRQQRALGCVWRQFACRRGLWTSWRPKSRRSATKQSSVSAHDDPCLRARNAAHPYDDGIQANKESNVFVIFGASGNVGR